MSTVKQTGYSWVSPYLIVQDVAKSVDFYTRAFGFEERDVATNENGVPVHAELFYKGQTIMLGKQGAYGGTTKSPAVSGTESPMILYVYCDDVDKFYDHALGVGASSVTQPDETFWGDRMCSLQDPDGYNWCFATHNTHGGTHH